MGLFLLNSMPWLSCSWCQFDSVLLLVMTINNVPVWCELVEHYGAKALWLVIRTLTWFTSFVLSQMSLCVPRIQPLSDALTDLYRQFNTLKDELGRLTTKFDSVEGFVDDLKDGRFTRPQRPVQRIPPSVGLRSPLRAQMRGPGRGIIKEPTHIRARRRGPQRP